MPLVPKIPPEASRFETVARFVPVPLESAAAEGPAGEDWQGGEGDVVEREVDAVEERLRGEAVEECVVELTREARHIL